jgi:hypothetical protein
MGADGVIYCLQELSDYDQFERLSHDLMALDGHRNIEPLGGMKDKGRDAIHRDASKGTTTVFAYSVREDWRKKLAQDCEKVKAHQHPCQRFVFLCTAMYTPHERDEAVAFVKTTYGWPLELYGLERLGVMLRTIHRQVVAQHPQIFCHPFFQVAGGLSLSPALDHVIVDHVDADTGLAHWLTRRLTLAGYSVWCRGLAPLAGASLSDTIRELVKNRGFRYICVLSHESLSVPDFAARRTMAHAVGLERGAVIVLPALARPVNNSLLDQETKRLEFARFDQSWALGLKQIEGVLSSTNCPRRAEGARELAIQSYFPADLVQIEPEVIASNLFPVKKVPEVVLRFASKKPMADDTGALAGQWAFRKVSDRESLSFHHPPRNIASRFGVTYQGGAVWATTEAIDGIKTGDLVKELIKKSLYAECQRQGLLYCEDRRIVYFPTGLLKNENLKFRRLDGVATFFAVTGERTHGRADRGKKYRYHIAPVFVPRGDPESGYEIIVRIRVRITDLEGRLYPGPAFNARRKKLCKSWWNEEWLSRTVGVMQFLAGDHELITIGTSESDRLLVDAVPRSWSSPVRLNEEGLRDTAPAIEAEEVVPSGDGEDDDEPDEIEDTEASEETSAS